MESLFASCLTYGFSQEKRGFLVHSDIVRTGEHPLVTAIFKPMLRGTFPQPIKYYWAYCATIFEDEDFVKQVILWKLGLRFNVNTFNFTVAGLAL